MKRVAVAVLLLTLLGVAACGDDEPAQPRTAVHAIGKTGAVVQYPFDLKKGVGVRLKLNATVRLSAVGAEKRIQDKKFETTMEFRCTKVLPAGDRVAQLEMRQFDVDGAATSDAKLHSASGSMTIGADRVATVVEVGGHNVDARPPGRNPFVTGGLSIYLPLPLGEMRIGDAVELPPELPADILPPSVQRAVEESSEPPRYRGSYTLSGTRDVEGTRVGEFDIDVSLKFSGKVSTAEGDFDVLIDMVCTGTQSFALNTGLATGSGTAHVVMRVEMKHGGQAGGVLTNGDIRAECEPLK